jgi:hypothetical protein
MDEPASALDDRHAAHRRLIYDLKKDYDRDRHVTCSRQRACRTAPRFSGSASSSSSGAPKDLCGSCQREDYVTGRFG